MFVTWELGLMGIYSCARTQKCLKSSRECAFFTLTTPHHSFPGWKKRVLKNKVRSVVRKVSFVKKREQKWRRENSRSTWFESQCRPSLYQISVEGICPSNKPLSLSGFKERERERKRSTLFDGALTKYLAKLLQLLLRCGSYVEDTHSHTHTKMEK